MHGPFLPGMDELAAAKLHKEQLRFWWGALRTAANRGGTFGMARMIFKAKYGDFPPRDFPCQQRDGKEGVAEAYPKLRTKT